MPELNGHDATAPYVPPPQPPALAEPVKMSAKLTPAKLRDIQQRLREPFAAELVYFKPQVVSYKGADSTAKGAAYADARAYSDRLNEVVGIDGWSQTAVISTSPTYEKEIKKKEKNPQTGQWDVETSKTVRIARISAVVTVTINGVGSHSNVGESDISDENATTIAYAQAFKRACVEFGLGRYLYDLPETGWLPFDTKTRQFKTQPTLPDWAIPKKPCSDCHVPIGPVSIQGVVYAIDTIIERSLKTYGRQLCGKCSQKAAKDAKERAGREIGVPAPAAA